MPRCATQNARDDAAADASTITPGTSCSIEYSRTGEVRGSQSAFHCGSRGGKPSGLPGGKANRRCR